MLQRLRLADALVAVAHDVVDEQVDALEHLAVLGLPPEVVLPGVEIPDEQHAQSSPRRSCASPPPPSNRSIASSKRRALAGERIRYAVSLSDSKSSKDMMTTEGWPARVMTTSSRSFTTPSSTSAYRERDSV